MGGALGILVAWWCNGYLGRSIVIGDRAGVEIPLNPTILGFAIVLSLAAGAVSGLFPAWMATRADVANALKGRTRGADRSQHRLRGGLIVGQMAMALVLLAGSALFVRGLRQFTERDPGWRGERLLIGSVMLPDSAYPDDDERRAFQRRLEDSLAAQPGVERVALTSSFPTWPYGSSTNMIAEGQPLARGEQPPLLYYTRVSAGFFDTLGIPVVRGSGLPRETRADGPRVAVVNESADRRFWPNQDPVGKRLGYAGDKPYWREIVGVVRDVGFPASLGAPDTPFQLYVPLEQDDASKWFVVAVRSATSPLALAGPLRQAVAALDPDLPVTDVATPAEHVRRALTSFGTARDVLSGFGLLGLLLAALGLYGVITNLVVQRTSEFGIRMAIGAQAHEVIWLVLRKGLTLAALGALAGLAGALGLARLLAAALPSLSAEPTAVVPVAAVLLAVAFVACWLPARRAARVDPVVALRSE
jgi:predicted permease